MTGRSYAGLTVLVVGCVCAVFAGVAGWRIGGPYGERFSVDPRVRRLPATALEAESSSAATDTSGVLAGEVVAADTDGDLILDTWNYLDAGRLIRIEFDDDQDGRIDRRRFFNPDGTVERTESLATGSGAE